MIGNIIKLATSFIPGPMGGLVGGLIGGLLGGGKSKQSDQAMLNGLSQAFNALFPQQAGGVGGNGQQQQPISIVPLPFSMNGQAAVALIQNPTGPFQGFDAQMREATQKLGQIAQFIANAQNAAGAGGAASAAAPAASSSAPASSSSPASGNFSTSNEAGWGKIDSMMSQAEKLSTSDKQSDQLKAQKMMQQAQRMFEMISKMLEQMSQMLSKSIQAMK